MGIFDKIFSRKDTHKNEKKEQIYQNEARPNINCEKMEKDDYEEIAKIEIHIEKDKVFSENELEMKLGFITAPSDTQMRSLRSADAAAIFAIFSGL